MTEAEVRGTLLQMLTAFVGFDPQPVSDDEAEAFEEAVSLLTIDNHLGDKHD